MATAVRAYLPGGTGCGAADDVGLDDETLDGVDADGAAGADVPAGPDVAVPLPPVDDVQPARNSGTRTSAYATRRKITA
jgi:hypothetical protein